MAKSSKDTKPATNSKQREPSPANEARPPADPSAGQAAPASVDPKITEILAGVRQALTAPETPPQPEERTRGRPRKHSRRGKGGGPKTPEGKAAVALSIP